MVFLSSILANTVDTGFSLFNVPSGPIALIIILLYIFSNFALQIIRIFIKSKKKDDLNNTNNTIESLSKDMSILNTQLTHTIAHYESEQRFRQELEKRIFRIERAVGIGNGDKPLTTRVALIEQDINNLKDKE